MYNNRLLGMIKKQRYAIVSFTKLTALITENKCFSHIPKPLEDAVSELS
jgi:hypothetical protein